MRASVGALLATLHTGLALAAGPYESTYVPLPTETTLIRDVALFTGNGNALHQADVLLKDGRIAAITESGATLAEPASGRVINGRGKWLTPGIIDVHSHLGTYPSPSVASTADGNEATDPNTAEVWVEHSVWPQDPQFGLALAGGVTTLHILPGSANLFGGRGVTLKNVPARTMQGMKFPGAPQSLKMACGENPKRVYGERMQAPMTRMGNVAGYRAAWAEAAAYRDQRQQFESGEAEAPPDRNLALDTLAAVLDGEILVHNHCYRADEMAVMMDIAEEFGYAITAFHHATESYKIADLLAEAGICSAVWADWWGFKLEAFDGITQNAALIDAAGACAIIHSDSEELIQRLNQEAAKAMTAGRRMGMATSDAQAMSWITGNAAKALGIAAETGTLSVGKAADAVLWDRHPFSVYARAEKVWIDGHLYYDRSDPTRQPVSDFDLGQTVAGGER
ncbi:MAG: amidohydrolase [Gammaproteobacteria bacterium]|nr:amidohydrolase [Gammaproteobacteria bacterium]MDE0271211.1 amidohydrolase [Gammaproteobacteria bacterium]